MSISGGELLARTLRDAGVTTVFALHGGHLNPFFLSCAEQGIELIDGRHEGAVGHAAEGYARATGGIGVAVVTAGAGYANALASLVTAHADRTPLLMITSSPPLREAELNELQGGIDQIAIAGPVTRWAHRVTAAHRVADLASLAIRKATGTPPGPVLLDVPVDVLFARVDEDRIRPYGRAGDIARPAPAPDAIAAAGALLRAAKHPAIVAGSGIRYSQAAADLQRFAEHATLPVFSQMGTSWLPTGHPLKAYNGWHLASLEAATGHRPDAILLVGARLGRFLGGRTGAMVPPDARLAQIGRLGPVEVPVVGDAGEALRALLADERPWPDYGDWPTAAAGAHRRLSRFRGEPDYLDGRMHPYHAVRLALGAVPSGATVVVDGGEAAGWVWESLAESDHVDVMGFGGYVGLLGQSTGLALGAQVARPNAPVVLFCGDGAAGFHIQEYDTMVRHRLPVVTIVVNNAVWAQSLRGQDRDYGERGVVITRLADTSYDKVAQGFGAYGERVTKLEDIAAAVGRAFATGRPACVNLSVAYGPEPPTSAGMGRRPAPKSSAAPGTEEIALPYYESTATGY